MEKIRKRLPKKWYIIPTEENNRAIGNWRSSGHFDWTNPSNIRIMHDGYKDCKGYAVNATSSLHQDSLEYLKECTEITFEEFKNLVLKEDVEPKIKTKPSENLSYLITFFKERGLA